MNCSCLPSRVVGLLTILGLLALVSCQQGGRFVGPAPGEMVPIEDPCETSPETVYPPQYPLTLLIAEEKAMRLHTARPEAQLQAQVTHPSIGKESTDPSFPTVDANFGQSAQLRGRSGRGGRGSRGAGRGMGLTADATGASESLSSTLPSNALTPCACTKTMQVAADACQLCKSTDSFTKFTELAHTD